MLVLIDPEISNLLKGGVSNLKSAANADISAYQALKFLQKAQDELVEAGKLLGDEESSGGLYSVINQLYDVRSLLRGASEGHVKEFRGNFTNMAKKIEQCLSLVK